MKIVYVCSEYPPSPHGGIGTFVQAVARALSSRHHEVTIVGLGDIEGETSDGGVRVVVLQRSTLPYVGNFLSRLRLRKYLLNLVKSRRVDVVEAPDFQGLVPFGVASCPVVIRLHLSVTSIYREAGWKIPKGLRFYERRTLIANSRWIAVSRYSLELAKKTFGVSPKTVEVIYNPIPPRPASSLDLFQLPNRYVLYASQLSRRKGALVLAEAARSVLGARGDVHLVYVGGSLAAEGPGAIEDEIRNIVGPELIDRVHFLGHVDRDLVLACMRRAMVFAFPSRLETFGLVVLEAMSCGVPVVCSSYPPGPEIVEDEVTGLLADPTSPADFGAKIARILDDPLLADQLAAAARKTIDERFSLEKCIDSTERFYQQCMNQ